MGKFNDELKIVVSKSSSKTEEKEKESKINKILEKVEKEFKNASR